MGNLIEDINGLSREAALEAVGYLGKSLGISAEEHAKERELLEPLTGQPYANLADIEQLARITLIAAASDPSREASVRKAIEGAGKKQFILGGAEIVALSVVALYALQVVMARGKVSEEQEIEIVEEKGKKTIKIRKSGKFGISGKLAGVLGAVLK